MLVISGDSRLLQLEDAGGNAERFRIEPLVSIYRLLENGVR